MKTFKIETPNKLYKGITEGVPFSKGIGFTDSESTRNVLVNDYGYKDVTEYPEAEKLSESTEESTEIISEGLDALKVAELKEIAKGLGLSNYSELKKEELVALIKEQKEQVQE